LKGCARLIRGGDFYGVTRLSDAFAPSAPLDLVISHINGHVVEPNQEGDVNRRWQHLLHELSGVLGRVQDEYRVSHG